MIHRLYVNNYRCLENFEMKVKGMPTVLLIGKNGAGKSTVRNALEILQRVARGTNRVRDLMNEEDFNRGKSDVPIRIELEAYIDGKLYEYTLALELPDAFKELRVSEERLVCARKPVFSRKQAQVTFLTGNPAHEAQFAVDWHLVALPVIQEQSTKDPLSVFRTWLSRSIIVAPIASEMVGTSNGDTLNPNRECSNFAEWFTGILSRFPASYTVIHEHLSHFMPDVLDFLNEIVSKESKNMLVRFQQDKATLSVEFKNLSDGEKCFFLCAVVLAANKYYGPVFCFWDEPDSHLSLDEVGHFIMSLRQAFDKGGQIIMTSHNSEAIRAFSDENTLLLDRKSHLEPTVLRPLADVAVSGDLIDALTRGDVTI